MCEALQAAFQMSAFSLPSFKRVQASTSSTAADTSSDTNKQCTQLNFMLAASDSNDPITTMPSFDINSAQSDGGDTPNDASYADDVIKYQSVLNATEFINQGTVVA